MCNHNNPYSKYIWVVYTKGFQPQVSRSSRHISIKIKVVFLWG